MLCNSERLISQDTCAHGTKRLDTSISPTVHADEVSLAFSQESFATHNTARHTNLQHRRLSASISPVEELLERIQCYEENSQGPCYHLGTLSRSRDANFTAANKPAYEHFSHLSLQRAHLTPKLSVTSQVFLSP